MSTISSTISHGITIGTDGYPSPLTITAAGYVGNVITDGGIAIDSSSVATVVSRSRENTSRTRGSPRLICRR